MRKNMRIDCSAAENMVSRYISGNLSLNEMEQFLDHIETCSSCYDELETQYIVNEVLQQLHEDEDIISDFKKLLAQDIRHAKRYVLLKRTRLILTGIILGCALIVGTYFLAAFLIDLF